MYNLNHTLNENLIVDALYYSPFRIDFLLSSLIRQQQILLIVKKTFNWKSIGKSVKYL